MQLSCPMCPSTKTPPVYHLANRPLIPLLFGKWEMCKDLPNERHRMNAFMGWGLLWNTGEFSLSLATTLLFNTQKAITALFPKWQPSVSCCPKGRRDESCNLFPTSLLYLSLQIRRDGINGTTAKWCLWFVEDYNMKTSVVKNQTLWIEILHTFLSYTMHILCKVICICVWICGIFVSVCACMYTAVTPPCYSGLLRGAIK